VVSLFPSLSSLCLLDFISPWAPYEQHPVPIKYLTGLSFSPSLLSYPLFACLIHISCPKSSAILKSEYSCLVSNGSSSFTLSMCVHALANVSSNQKKAEMSTKELYIFKCGLSPMTGLYWHYTVAHALKHWAPLFLDYCRLWPRRSPIASGFGVEK